MTEPPDLAERKRAITARERNVLVDAGAGAGKTSILVARVLALVAPQNDADAPIPLERIAAVTFTRRAAGELRLRVRERLLRELGSAGNSPVRTRRLLDALGRVDSAALGTIHSFADRLLRLQPMKARLSPAFQIVDEVDALADETFGLLLHAVQGGTLAADLDGDPSYLAEVERTWQEALRAGLLVHTVERDPIPPRVGLDLLVRDFIEHRDRDLAWEGTGAFDSAGFAAAVDVFLRRTQPVVDDDFPGTRWLLRLRDRLAESANLTDPLLVFDLIARLRTGLKRFKKTKHFAKKSVAQAVWSELDAGLAGELLAPIQRAVTHRLARTRQAIVQLYERVKTRHEALDSIDLLLTLRNLLRDDLDVRRFYQGLFDHILVDELQDTDPLQAEIVLYLAEETATAARWQDVEVGTGRLTLVGDPKQSIYRFRRADVGMYEQLREQVARAPHEAITLSANFRSSRSLVAWANARFAEILGTSAERRFDVDTGQVFHQRQDAVRADVDGLGVHALPYAFPDGEQSNADGARALEGRAITAYLRWLVERSGLEIYDVDAERNRSIAWSDIAVLALVTTNLGHLFEAFDAASIPHAIAGGTLFTSDALHQQFILGLRAIADRNDGVAEAALLRPPFFAIDLLDLVRERALVGDERAARAAAARAWLVQTRRERFARSPGQTARALLEETGIGRVAALGPNGEQRLRHLRELCVQLELLAASEALDYDAVTARMRDWVEHPPKLDPPRPIGAEAVQVLTVHQAKGLEFPVVVLWDGMGLWAPTEKTPTWRVVRDGTGWYMKTEDVQWEEPPGNAMLEREKAYAAAERRRLVYVAATRARDLLVVPKPVWPQLPSKYIHAALLANASRDLVHTVDTYVDGVGASWSSGLDAPASSYRDVENAELEAQWLRARDSARAPHHVPRSVTAAAKSERTSLRIDEANVETQSPRPVRIGRFGPVFGDAVHHALGLVLLDALAPRAAVARATTVVGLSEHHDEAVEDVECALAALHADGLVENRELRVEYPIAAPRDGYIISGYIDLVSAAPGDIAVIDFKTDRWPRGVDAVADAFPAYVAQVKTYADLLGAQRAALLFSATGRLVWL